MHLFAAFVGTDDRRPRIALGYALQIIEAPPLHGIHNFLPGRPSAKLVTQQDPSTNDAEFTHGEDSDRPRFLELSNPIYQ